MSLFQVSIAVGCATRDRTIAFASTFATFFTRAFDQIRMAAISDSNINLCGSHCGVSIGKGTHSILQQSPSLRDGVWHSHGSCSVQASWGGVTVAAVIGGSCICKSTFVVFKKNEKNFKLSLACFSSSA